MEQRKDEGLNPDPDEIKNYFLRQWDSPYRSTELFCKWLESFNVFNAGNIICDLGCGAGSNSYYIWNKYKDLTLYGIDISPLLINLAKEQSQKKEASVIKYEVGDLYDFPPKYVNQFDGILLFQVLSWLPEYENAIQKIVKLNPKWIAFSCLMNDSLVECEINIKDYSRNKTGNYQEKYYNVYSAERVKNLFNSLGYNTFKHKKMEMDMDIPEDKTNKGMGTYTKNLENGERIQISGGILLNWKFAIAMKN
jgi:trans-aconitate methyltransferase